MKKLLSRTALAILAITIGSEAFAVEWNVSVWGKRRASRNMSSVWPNCSISVRVVNLHSTFPMVDSARTKRTLMASPSVRLRWRNSAQGYHADKNRAITVLELPFLGVNTLDEEVAVATAVYNHPAVAAEMAQWNAKLLMTSPMPQYNLVGTGKPPATLADFNGMRVRATGGLGRAFKAVGGIPTSVTATEAFQAMQGGVVDTVAFAQHAHLSFGTINEADWWTANLNPGTVNCPVVVNIDAYKGLSDEHRAALDESVSEALDHYLANYAGLIERWDGILEEKKVARIEMPQAELDAFRDAATPLHAAWIKEMDAQGLPAQELYDLVLSTLAKAQGK